MRSADSAPCRTRTLVAGILALAVPAAGSPGAPLSPLLEAVRAHVRAERPALLREYVAFLALPNLASDAGDIRRNAGHVAQMMEKRGIAASLLDGEGGPPAVYGELTIPGARKTLAIYAHYDGQPVDPSRWASPPWTPVLRDGPLGPGAREIPLASVTGPLDGEWRLFARSSSDDKVSVFAVLSALDALRSTGATPAVNLKLLFEGEEERGSPHLRAVLEKNRERLRADAWLLGDGPVHQSRRMQLYFGARGVSDVEITLYGPTRPLHSGHYGNWAPNPAIELAQLLAGLRDRDGRITIAGWYDDVRPVTEAERAALATVPDVDAALREELALPATEAGGARLVERILLPALNLRGIASGAVGATAANAIPTDARASIDFRLVPDETPARVRERFEAQLRARGYALTHVEPTLQQRRATPRLVRLEWGDGYPAARTSMDLPFSRALERVVGNASGGPVVALPTLGGSIPMYLFEEVFRVPVVGLPIANHDNNQHGADENLRLQNLWDGIAIYAGVLAGLGDGW